MSILPKIRPYKKRDSFRVRPAKKEEQTLQMAVVTYLNVMAKPNLIWHHPPNGERRDAKTGAKLKKMGTKRGVPDLEFVLDDGRAAYIELKSAEGKLSESQREFRAKCNSYVPPVPYREARSLDEVIEILKEWNFLRTSFFG